MIGCGLRGDSARPPHGTAPGPAPARTDLILGFEEALSHPPRVPGRLHVAGAVSSGQGLGDVCGGGTREPSVGAGRAPHSRRSGCFQSPTGDTGREGFVTFLRPGFRGGFIQHDFFRRPGLTGFCGGLRGGAEGAAGPSAAQAPGPSLPASPSRPPRDPGPAVRPTWLSPASPASSAACFSRRRFCLASRFLREAGGP